MATIKTNIGEVTEAIKEKLAKLGDKEYIPRTLSFDLIDLMTKRIHIDGKAADDSQIGTYNKDYLSLRRRKYNRTADSKIIVSLTRQLENDWNVIATDQGYGIGFLNPFNFQKARWVEAQKGKKIFFLSPSEQQYVNDTVNILVKDALA
jgi:hypothetical protein